MTLYLVQACIGQDWTNSWYPTATAARKAIMSQTNEARLFKVYIGKGRDGLCEVLNLADANYMNLDCELLGVVPSNREKQR